MLVIIKYVDHKVKAGNGRRKPLLTLEGHFSGYYPKSLSVRQCTFGVYKETNSIKSSDNMAVLVVGIMM